MYKTVGIKKKKKEKTVFTPTQITKKHPALYVQPGHIHIGCAEWCAPRRLRLKAYDTGHMLKAYEPEHIHRGSSEAEVKCLWTCKPSEGVRPLR